MINGFIEDEHEQVITFDRPVKAVAIDPGYTKHTKQFVTGDDKVCYMRIPNLWPAAKGSFPSNLVHEQPL